MGQKVHPSGFRVGITKKHQSLWFARFNKNKYLQTVLEDRMIRDTLHKLFPELLNPISKIANKRDQNTKEKKSRITQIKIERNLVPYEIGIQIHAENCKLLKSAIKNLQVKREIIVKLQKTRQYLTNLKTKFEILENNLLDTKFKTNLLQNFNLKNRTKNQDSTKISKIKALRKKLAKITESSKTSNIKFNSSRKILSKGKFGFTFLKNSRLQSKAVASRGKRTKQTNFFLKKSLSKLFKIKILKAKLSKFIQIKTKRKSQTLDLNTLNKPMIKSLKITELGAPARAKQRSPGFADKKKIGLKRKSKFAFSRLQGKRVASHGKRSKFTKRQLKRQRILKKRLRLRKFIRFRDRLSISKGLFIQKKSKKFVQKLLLSPTPRFLKDFSLNPKVYLLPVQKIEKVLLQNKTGRFYKTFSLNSSFSIPSSFLLRASSIPSLPKGNGTLFRIPSEGNNLSLSKEISSSSLRRARGLGGMGKGKGKGSCSAPLRNAGVRGRGPSLEGPSPLTPKPFHKNEFRDSQTLPQLEVFKKGSAFFKNENPSPITSTASSTEKGDKAKRSTYSIKEKQKDTISPLALQVAEKRNKKRISSFKNKGIASQEKKSLTSSKMSKIFAFCEEDKTKTSFKPNIFHSRLQKKIVTMYIEQMKRKFLPHLNDLFIQYTTQKVQKNFLSLGYLKKWDFKLQTKNLKTQPIEKLNRLIQKLREKFVMKLNRLRKEFIVFGSFSCNSSEILGLFQLYNFVINLKDLVNDLKRNFKHNIKTRLAISKMSSFNKKQSVLPLLIKQPLTGNIKSSLSIFREPAKLKVINGETSNGLLPQKVFRKKLENISNECRKLKFIEYLKDLIKKHRTDNIYLYLASLSEARKKLKEIKNELKENFDFYLPGTHSLKNIMEDSLLCTKTRKKETFSDTITDFKINEQVNKVLLKLAKKHPFEKTFSECKLEELERRKTMWLKNLQLTPKISIKFFSVNSKSLNQKASVISESVADSLEKRKAFRKVIKSTKEKLMRNPEIKGVKIQVAGRLNGAEIARTEWVRAGRVPLQTLRANLDYSYRTANTIYGIIGIKVWIFKGFTKLISK